MSDGQADSGSSVSGQGRPARVEVFGFDVGEISQIRRIRAMRELGHAVHSFTMRRGNMNVDFVPDWPNTHLYDTENENLAKRAMVVLKSILKMLGPRHRRRLREADVIFARNLDMLAIAWAARALAGARAVPLVYECLDINGALCGAGLKSRAMRAAERRILAGIQMLVVSSPGFMRHYFEPMQGYDGAVALWENKLAAGAVLPERPRMRTRREGVLRVGWVGTIRCAPSLALLTALAERMGARVEIHAHGVVHYHVVPNFDTVIADHPNMFYHGPYAYPADLGRVYGDVDVVWAQDLWQMGNNSEWLLPNRIYEASWGGCPSLALASTETGHRISNDGLGWVVERAEAAPLAALLDSLSQEEITARGQALLDRPDSDFVQSPDEISAVIDRVRGPGGGHG